MDSAIELFLEKGFSKTTAQDITEKIHITRGAFYFHFIDKEDLLKQTLHRELNFISELIINSILEHGTEKQKLNHLLTNVIENFYGNQRFQNIVELTWFKLEHTQDSRLLNDKTSFNEFFIEEVNSLLNGANAKGNLKKDVDPIKAAIEITTIVLGIYRLFFVSPKYGRDKLFAKSLMLSFVQRIFD